MKYLILLCLLLTVAYNQEVQNQIYSTDAQSAQTITSSSSIPLPDSIFKDKNFKPMPSYYETISTDSALITQDSTEPFPSIPISSSSENIEEQRQRHEGRDRKQKDGEERQKGEHQGQHQGKRDGQRDGQHEGQRDGQRDGRGDGQHDGQRDGQHDGQRDGQRDGKRDGKHDGKHDGQKGRHERDNEGRGERDDEELNLRQGHDDQEKDGKRKCFWKKLQPEAKILIIGLVVLLVVMSVKYYRLKKRLARQQQDAQAAQQNSQNMVRVNLPAQQYQNYVQQPEQCQSQVELQHLRPQQHDQQQAARQIYPQLQLGQPIILNYPVQQQQQ